MDSISLSDLQSLDAVQLPPAHRLDVCEGSKDPDGFKCKHCHLLFFSIADLSMHISLKPAKKLEFYSQNNPIVNCPDCSSEFSTFKGMRQHHGKIHTVDRKAKCKLCSKRFKDNYAVKFHKRQVHEKSTQVMCVLCEKVTYNKFSYLAHYKKCSGRFFAKKMIDENN